MFDARRLLFDTVCVAVLAGLMIWGAEAIARVPIALPGNCTTPARPKVAEAGAPPSTLNLAECGDAAGTKPATSADRPLPR